MASIVPQKATCRHCGAPVSWLERCRGCGKRRLWPTGGGGLTRRY